MGDVSCMRQISEVTRQDLFDIIQHGFSGKQIVRRNTSDYGHIDVEEEVHIYMPFNGRLGKIEFIERLYPLNDMLSIDRRYEDAKGDIYCHTISFNDWPEFWFLDDERFELKNGFADEPILKFLCEMLHPAVRKEDGPWKDYVEKFNELLKPDGYEIYASYRISDRDVYKFREYVDQDVSFNERCLFTNRYEELIQTTNGQLVDNICGEIDYKTQESLVSIMIKFEEPSIMKPNRYDNYEVKTDALRLAIERFITIVGYQAIDVNTDSLFDISYKDQLASIFIPYLFDIIELQYNELSSVEKEVFRQEMNGAFKKGSVDFDLSDNGLIVQRIEHEVLDNTIGENIGKIKEPGLRALLDEAIALHRQPRISAHKDAVEKVWDALERLKTHYTSLDKKNSMKKVIRNISSGKAEFDTLFNTEFKALTDIGNKYRIRHHETDRFEISDVRHYDYFFNRCLSLIALAIQYIE